MSRSRKTDFANAARRAYDEYEKATGVRPAGRLWDDLPPNVAVGRAILREMDRGGVRYGQQRKDVARTKVVQRRLVRKRMSRERIDVDG